MSSPNIVINCTIFRFGEIIKIYNIFILESVFTRVETKIY